MKQRRAANKATRNNSPYIMALEFEAPGVVTSKVISVHCTDTRDRGS